MASRYTPITLEELVQVLRPDKGWRCISPTAYQELQFQFKVKAALPEFVTASRAANTLVAQQRPSDIIIRVYSSITPDGLSRERGQDAIRVCLLACYADQQVGIRSFSRVYRTQGWREHLRERVLEAHEFAKTRIRYCPECGRLLVCRQAKKDHHEFYGCLGYPTCKYTENL